MAGVDALGLRLAPAAAQSSIDHVDVWADPDTGVVLRVEVFGRAGRPPAFTSRVRGVLGRHAAGRAHLRSAVPRGADFEFDEVLDIADAANQYAPSLPPDTVAGLAKAPQADRAVGVYGSGVTRCSPSRCATARPTRCASSCGLTPGVRNVPQGTLVTIGPLGVLMTGDEHEGGWLIAGTVTADTAHRRGARTCFRGTVIVGDGR